MKIREYSDIHLDHFIDLINEDISNGIIPRVWYPPAMSDDSDTVLVLAGDLWFGTCWIEYKGFSWISQVAPRFKQVIVVLGNHDYWSQITIRSGADDCNNLLQKKNIGNVVVLDQSSFELDDVLFLGCTLWTDMSKGDCLTMMNMSRMMYYDARIVYDNFINNFSSVLWTKENKHHVDYIKCVVSQNKNKKLVVITHHIPSFSFCDPAYIGDSSNAYYASDLSDLILDNPNIKMWFHGHSHYQHETYIGNTLVVNNAVGYVGEHCEQRGLVSHKIFEITNI